MAGALIETGGLYLNQEVRVLHADGLENELAGRFDQAQESFRAAQEALTEDAPTTDRDVQEARIIRDSGFTDVRAAITTSDVALLEQARTTILDSLALTEGVIDAPQLSLVHSPKGYREYNAAWRAIYAEHGATQNLLGRIGTVSSVMREVDMRRGVESAERIGLDRTSQFYEDAHFYHSRGSNGYYRVANAMTAARNERLRGNLGLTGLWIARAALGVGWTLAHDPKHFFATARTGSKRLGSLRSPDSAASSVLVRP